MVWGQLLLGQTGTLTIQVEGLRNPKGKVQCYLYNYAEAHLNIEKAYKSFRLEVKGDIAKIKLEDIPNGEYSLGLFHDENEDAICNLNFFGIPVEGYGFSRNYRVMFRAPKFEETNFRVDGDTLLKVSVIY
jgi:uncharacterized protein (DUF2141 family)